VQPGGNVRLPCWDVPRATASRVRSDFEEAACSPGSGSACPTAPAPWVGSGAPRALGADWAAVLTFDPTGAQDDVLAVSPDAPAASAIRIAAPLRLGAVRLAVPGTDRHYRGSALVPIGDGPLGLLLVRADGVDFHRSELWRLSQVGSVLGAVMAVGV